MELITNGRPFCDCYTKLVELEKNLNDEGTYLHLGARARCDCNTEYMLDESQRDGRYWRTVGPAPARA